VRTTKKQVRKIIKDKLSPQGRNPDSDVLEIQEAIEVMRRSQQVQRERVEPLLRHRAYISFESAIR
jgi:hypothetical protein